MKKQSLNDVASDKLKLLIHGSSGSGKTSLASTIALPKSEGGADLKTLMIDLPGEHGIQSIKGTPQAENITLVRPESTDETWDLFWQLQTGQEDYDAVIFEGAASHQSMFMRKLQGRPENTPRKQRDDEAAMTIQRWGDVKEEMTDLFTFWMGLANADAPNGPIHVVFTSQSKTSEITTADGEDRQVTFPDVSSGSRSAALATPDFILYCFVERDLDNDEHFRHAVRIGPHDIIETKLHVSMERAKKLPDVLGTKKPLTLPAFARAVGIEL